MPKKNKKPLLSKATALNKTKTTLADHKRIYGLRKALVELIYTLQSQSTPSASSKGAHRC